MVNVAAVMQVTLTCKLSSLSFFTKEIIFLKFLHSHFILSKIECVFIFSSSYPVFL